MEQNDQFLQNQLAKIDMPAVNSTGAPSDRPTEQQKPAKAKKEAGWGSFVMGFVFGLLGVLIACCWGGAGKAFKGFLWRLGISIVLVALSSVTR